MANTIIDSSHIPLHIKNNPTIFQMKHYGFRQAELNQLAQWKGTQAADKCVKLCLLRLVPLKDLRRLLFHYYYKARETLDRTEAMNYHCCRVQMGRTTGFRLYGDNQIRYIFDVRLGGGYENGMVHLCMELKNRVDEAASVEEDWPQTAPHICIRKIDGRAKSLCVNRKVIRPDNLWFQHGTECQSNMHHDKPVGKHYYALTCNCAHKLPEYGIPFQLPKMINVLK